jgi:multicomponent Na+:H+ antiporter subunit E
VSGIIVFLWNLLLALLWGAGTGSFTSLNLLLGFLIGLGALFIARAPGDETTYFRRIYLGANLVVFYLWDLVRANLRLAKEVLRPLPRLRPAVVAVPLELRGEDATTFLASLISLTPGSLTLDLRDEPPTLFVHGLFVDSPAAFRAGIKHDLERRIIEVFG